MTDNNQERDFRGPEIRDSGFRGSEEDRQLDAALAKYAAVEPRPGLEERVLANLRVERSRVPNRAWWRWGLAGALAAVIVVALALAWKSGKPSPQQVVQHPSTGQPTPSIPPEPTVAKDENSATQSPKRKTRPRAVQHGQDSVVAKASPKLDVFPSPQPLSEQEKILANYVAKNPENAALIAEARMEDLRHEQEIRAADAGNDSALTPNR